MTKLIKRYAEYPSGRREWGVTGKKGSISFWIVKSSLDWAEEFYGGVETHYREENRPDYLKDGKHEFCAHNEGVCYHYGTSLWASEYWIPNVLPFGDSAIWRRLESHYYETFEGETP